jgi:hypothetical protein
MISFCVVILLVFLWQEHDGDIGAIIKTVLLTGVLFLVISRSHPDRGNQLKVCPWIRAGSPAVIVGGRIGNRRGVTRRWLPPGREKEAFRLTGSAWLGACREPHWAGGCESFGRACTVSTGIVCAFTTSVTWGQ